MMHSVGAARCRRLGYAAFVEYAGKRIVFDAGNDPTILARNAKAADVDLSKLDFVVGWRFETLNFEFRADHAFIPAKVGDEG